MLRDQKELTKKFKSSEDFKISALDLQNQRMMLRQKYLERRLRYLRSRNLFRGPAGPVGQTGPTGLQGIPGRTGQPGPSGSAGTEGQSGSWGPPGPQGPQGQHGPVGLAGPVGQGGQFGPQGLPGMDGIDGPEGENGSAGPEGPVGPEGLEGDATTGSQGPVGPVGTRGPPGPAGVSGRIGMLGVTGPAGPPGIGGQPGPDGVTGVAGAVGPSGEPGSAGAPGLQGLAGPPGPAGNSGAIGSRGIVGAVGQPGGAGALGTHGIVGQLGPSGASGAGGVGCLETGMYRRRAAVDAAPLGGPPESSDGGAVLKGFVVSLVMSFPMSSAEFQEKRGAVVASLATSSACGPCKDSAAVPAICGDCSLHVAVVPAPATASNTQAELRTLYGSNNSSAAGKDWFFVAQHRDTPSLTLAMASELLADVAVKVQTKIEIPGGAGAAGQMASRLTQDSINRDLLAVGLPSAEILEPARVMDPSGSANTFPLVANADGFVSRILKAAQAVLDFRSLSVWNIQANAGDRGMQGLLAGGRNNPLELDSLATLPGMIPFSTHVAAGTGVSWRLEGTRESSDYRFKVSRNPPLALGLGTSDVVVYFIVTEKSPNDEQYCLRNDAKRTSTLLIDNRNLHENDKVRSIQNKIAEAVEMVIAALDAHNNQVCNINGGDYVDSRRLPGGSQNFVKLQLPKKDFERFRKQFLSNKYKVIGTCHFRNFWWRYSGHSQESLSGILNYHFTIKRKLTEAGVWETIRSSNLFQHCKDVLIHYIILN